MEEILAEVVQWGGMMILIVIVIRILFMFKTLLNHL
jgi:hypothetical protein